MRQDSQLLVCGHCHPLFCSMMAAPVDEDTSSTFAVNMTALSATISDDDSQSNLEAGQGQICDPACDPESIHNELAEDHVYTVKFTFAASRLDTIKKLVNVFIDKALNEIGVVFFKAQSYYRSYHSNHGDLKDNDRSACLIEFHLFSIECLNDDVHKAMEKFVSAHLYPEDPFNKLEDLHCDVLLRHGTLLRKPVYRFVKMLTH